MLMTDQLINLSQVTGQIIPDNWNIPDEWHMITQSLKREKHVLIPRELSTLTQFYTARTRTRYWPHSCPWALHSLLGTLHLCVGSYTHTHTQNLYIHLFPYVKIFYIKYHIFHVYVVFMQVCTCVHTCVHAACRDLRLTLESSSITVHCTHWGRAS